MRSGREQTKRVLRNVMVRAIYLDADGEVVVLLRHGYDECLSRGQPERPVDNKQKTRCWACRQKTEEGITRRTVIILAGLRARRGKRSETTRGELCVRAQDKSLQKETGQPPANVKIGGNSRGIALTHHRLTATLRLPYSSASRHLAFHPTVPPVPDKRQRLFFRRRPVSNAAKFHPLIKLFISVSWIFLSPSTVRDVSSTPDPTPHRSRARHAQAHHLPP